MDSDIGISAGSYLKNTRTDKYGNIIKRFCGMLARYALILFIISISLYPFFWLLMSSLKTHFEIYNSGLALPRHPSFDAYIYAIQSAPIFKYYFNSIIVSFSSTCINLFAVGMASYVVARFDFKLKKYIVICFAATLFLPGIALNYPVFKLIQMLNLLDTKTGLVYVYTAFGLPITFFLLQSYFLSVPREIDDAANIDGAGFLRTFIQIMIPMVKPGISSAAILQFMGVWNEFFFAMLLTTTEKSRTIPLSLSYFVGRFHTDLAALFAAMIIIILPTIIVFIALKDQVVNSLTAGAVKE